MSKKASNSKFFGLLLIVSSLVSLGIWYQYEFIPSSNKGVIKEKVTSNPKAKAPLQKIWEKDIKLMVEKKLFNQEITSLYKVRVFLLDQNLHSHFKGLKAPFKFNKKGANLLEVSFMSHYSELDKEDKLIIQYNLISRNDRNMFWEYSRTIPLPKDLLNR